MHVKKACLLAVVASMAVVTAHAAPRSAAGSGRHFLQAAENLDSWHVGGYGRTHKRRVKEDSSKVKTDIEISRGLVVVGYDVLPWLTVYGAIGGSDADIKLTNESDSAVELGVGAWFNLLDHDTLDFLETIHRFRIQGALQYTVFSNDDITWNEIAGNVTFGLTNEIIGNKTFWPHEITVYAGPAMNLVLCSDYKVSSSNSFGLVAGIETQINKRTGLGVAFEKYSDDHAITGHLMVRF